MSRKYWGVLPYYLIIVCLFAGGTPDRQLCAECRCQESYTGKVCLFLRRNGRKTVACIK